MKTTKSSGGGNVRAQGSRTRRAAEHNAKASPQPRLAKAPLTVSREELLVDGTDRDFRRLVEGLLPLLGIHTSIRDGYASLLGLAGPQYTMLLCVRNLYYDGPVNVRTVADHLRLSGSFITVETNVLEQKGLLRKERGGDDRRVVALSLTPKGTALLDSIAALRQKVNDVQFGCLNSKEFRVLVPLIERLVQSGERAVALLNYLRAYRVDAIEALASEV